MLVQTLNRLRNIDQEGVDEDLFEDVVFETFTTLSTDGRDVELIPNGAEKDVTYA
jgi:hypothetical protein